MSVPSQIRSKAARINIFYNRLRQTKDRCHGFACDSTSWWQGGGGNKQRSKYREIEAEISKFSRVLNKLEYSTRSLSYKVQQARDERRRKEQDQLIWA